MARNNSVSSTLQLLNKRYSGTSMAELENDGDNFSCRTGSTAFPSLPPRSYQQQKQRDYRPNAQTQVDGANGSAARIFSHPRSGSIQTVPFQPSVDGEGTSTPRAQRYEESESEGEEDIPPTLRDPERGRKPNRKQPGRHGTNERTSFVGRFFDRIEDIYDRVTDRRHGHHRQGPSESHHFCHLAVSLIALLLSLATVSFFIVLIYSGSIKIGGDSAEDRVSLCVPEDTTKDFRSRGLGDLDCNGKTCCAYTTSERARLQQALVDRQLNTQSLGAHALPSRQRQSPSKRECDMPFAHVPMGMVHDTKGILTNSYPVKLLPDLQHNTQDGRRSCNATVDQWGITIREIGIYFVYSSIRFEVENNNCPKTPTPNSHFVYEMDGGKSSRRLLQSVFTCTPNMSSEGQTRFVGGTFCLKKGRKLNVFVDRQSVRTKEAENSYLGLYMVSRASEDTC